MRQNKEVTVFDQSEFGEDWPPTNGPRFLEWFKDTLDLVPPEFAESSKVKLEADSNYGDSPYVNLSVTYSRPETDEEMVERESEALRAKLRTEAEEKRTLLRLLDKYEGPRRARV